MERRNQGDPTKGAAPESTAAEVIEAISRDNHAVIVGEGATPKYIAYLRSGGSSGELWEAISGASNETTARAAFLDITEALLGRTSE